MPSNITISGNTGGTYNGVNDARIQEGVPGSNDNSAASYSLRGQTGGNRRLVVKFPGLSNIAGPVTVTAATLSIFDEVGVNAPYQVARLTRNWVLSEVTWDNYNSGNTWTTGGATGAGDSSATVLSTWAGTVAYQGMSNAQLIADVQDMINNPSTNFGWLVYKTDDTDGSDTVTGNAGTDGQRPTLTIDYTSAGATYTLTAAQGSYSLTGQSANLLENRVLPAAQGSYALTGQTANLSYSTASILTAVQGSYSLIGSQALVDVSFNADTGFYTLTGQAAGLTYTPFNNYNLTAVQGSYALTGFAANILENKVLTADRGQYNLTGQFNTMVWSGAPVVVGGQNRSMNISKLRIGL